MADQPDNLPKFDSPPVIETVIGVQFSPIPGITSAHFGWFWKSYLENFWTNVQETMRLPDQAERFGEEIAWSLPNLASLMAIGPMAFAPQGNRIQISDAGRDRMIQVQDNRFHYNWQKHLNSYPSFETNRRAFSHYLEIFRRFLRDSGLGTTPDNLWEITYVDHIPKGTLWEQPSDWSAIFPGLLGIMKSPSGGIVSEGLGGEWRFEITPKRGRMRIQVQLAKAHGRDEELLVLNITARGSVREDEAGWGLESGLTIGHDAIVRMFRDIASPEALVYWGIH